MSPGQGPFFEYFHPRSFNFGHACKENYPGESLTAVSTTNTPEGKEGLAQYNLVLLRTKPVNSDREVWLHPFTAPHIDSKRNFAQGVLQYYEWSSNVDTCVHLQLLRLQFFVIFHPRFHNLVTELRAVWNIAVLQAFSKQEQQVPKVAAFNQIN
ncbi:hypothetical protein B0H10DRAFT_1963476 [Mycena sp. CBHHK59/15]|nr:hypothetical protein B0H10DRAFT_1963476 [Mycena sp. CBHHK59/15]